MRGGPPPLNSRPRMPWPLPYPPPYPYPDSSYTPPGAPAPMLPGGTIPSRPGGGIIGIPSGEAYWYPALAPLGPEYAKGATPGGGLPVVWPGGGRVPGNGPGGPWGGGYGWPN